MKPALCRLFCVRLPYLGALEAQNGLVDVEAEQVRINAAMRSACQLSEKHQNGVIQHTRCKQRHR